MKILFISPLFDRVNGQSLASEEFLKKLECNKSFNVEIVNLRKNSKNQRFSVGYRICEIIRILFSVWKKRSGANLIYFTVSESYLGNIKDMLVLSLCYRMLDRVIVHLHGGANMRKIMSKKNKVFRWLNLHFLNRVGAIVVLGNRHLDIYDGVLDTKKIHIVPNFASDELFRSDLEVCEKFSNMEPLNILFLSNFLRGKGYQELIDAFIALDEETKNKVQLDFAGDIKDKDIRVRFLEITEKYPQVHYHGIVHGEDKKRLFSNAHLFCLPTYYPYEGQPISILEAYASGCVVLTTDHSGIFDVFEHQINGYEVNKRSSLSVQNTIKEILESPTDLRKMAVHNLRAATEKYVSKTYTSKLLETLNFVLIKTKA